MSLINDALKKAQRLRAEPVPPGGYAGGSGHVAKRGQPMRAQTVILLSAVAATLIVLSVVVTVYFVNLPSPAERHAAVVGKLTSAPADAPAPNIVVPISATANGGGKPATTPAAATPLALEGTPPVTLAGGGATAPVSPISVAPVAAALTDNPVLATPPPEISLPVTVRPKGPEARIQSFIDSIRVTGIRSSGSDSKVIMNDRVYRVNDVVDRTLGVKLMKVQANQLTFTDANGFTYTRNF